MQTMITATMRRRGSTMQAPTCVFGSLLRWPESRATDMKYCSQER